MCTSVRVRMVVDIVASSGTFQAGTIHELPKQHALTFIDLGWAEKSDTPPIEVAVQAPEEHAVALRQRRGPWPQ